MFDKFKSLFNAATLTPPPLPKAPNAPQSLPAHRTTVVALTSPIVVQDRNLANTDRLLARAQASTPKTLIELSQSSPELSSAIFMALRTAIPERFTVVGKNLDGQVDRAATALAQELLTRLTFLGNVDGSYGSQQTIQSLSEQLGKELLIYGAASVEVALDKGRIPASLNVVGQNTLRRYDEDKSVRFVQYIGGVEIDLDIPTFIYVSLDQIVSSASASSPLESALQPVLADLQFSNDIRRALSRAVLPRLKATIDMEKLKKSCPPEILADSEAFAKYQNALITQVQTVLNGLAPEDALVSFDMVDYSYVDGGKDPGAIIERVQKVLNGKLATGSKALPVTLGYASTSNASSAESLLYLKQCDGIRRKLNELYSRALTVAVRLMGIDGYVEFTYAPLDLRPDSELAAFRAMDQAVTLEQLSLGFLTDDEAALQLTGHLTPDGFKPLSGTGFKTASPAVNQNPTSNTANATEKALTPNTPTQKKS